MSERVVIVGGVAGGMSTATRLRRLDADATITVFERSGHVSFANCGLPYFVGGLIEEEEDLTLQTPEQLFDRFRLDARVNDEVVAIDRVAHTVTARSTVTGAETCVGYDKLVLSMGAAPVRPPIPGYERCRTLRTVEDVARLVSDVDIAPSTAVVIGAGFIGLEMAENLVGQGIDVTIVEATPQVLPPLDPELAILVEDELVAHGVRVETGATVASVEDRSVTLSDGRVLAADLVVGAIGVRPDVRLAEAAGLELGPNGGIAVNDANQTNDPDVYAVGDAVEKRDAVSRATSLIALANVANRQGRRVADHIAGRPSHAVGSIGTAIVKVFDLVAATVGWSERRLRAQHRPFRAIHSHPFDHATYYPGATRMAAKLIFDPDDGSILGAQIVGRNGVDKRIDVIATAMAGGLTADRLADLELAYAPPFSSAKDPVNLLGYMAENVLSGDCDVVDPAELDGLVSQGWTLLDVRTSDECHDGVIPGSINVPIDSLREKLDSLEKGPTVVYCEVGQRGHTATALMHELGFQVRNLDGGYRTWDATMRAQGIRGPDAAGARGQTDGMTMAEQPASPLHGARPPTPRVASRADRAEAGRAQREAVPLAAHAEVPGSTARPDPVATLGAQDISRLSELVPIRYGRMVATPFTFLRGAAAVMAADLGPTPRTDLEVQLCGDAHVANFGAFSAPDRRLVVDVNDFDETLPGPFEWDVKRLAASLAVAGRNNGLDAEQTRSVASATVEVYRTALAFAAVTDPLDVWYSRVEVDDLAKVARGAERKGLEKLIRQAVTKANRKDRVRAAAKLTEVVDGHRIISADPPLIVRPEPELLAAELESIVTFLEDCHASLPRDRQHILDAYAVVDLAHKVVGVGSVGTRCWILLLESGDGEPLFLQFKEATTSVLEPHLGPSEFETSGQRVVEGQQLVQAASDAFLGWGRYSEPAAGEYTDYYFRQLWDGKYSAPIEEMGPKRLRRYGRFCGLVLARAHARSGDAASISGYLGDDDTFDRAITAFAEAYADRTWSDHARLAAAVADGEVEANTGH